MTEKERVRGKASVDKNNLGFKGYDFIHHETGHRLVHLLWAQHFLASHLPPQHRLAKIEARSSGKLFPNKKY